MAAKGRFWFLVSGFWLSTDRERETRNEKRPFGRHPNLRPHLLGSCHRPVPRLTCRPYGRSYDWRDTIILLFGMMIVVANLQLSGFFSLVAERVVEHAHRPFRC
jgi:hypothetical protein